ncbi:MAG: radical SAM family heme chaperone HemW [Candidatus Cloacimonas sp.]|nr:radical SAM family heme chaperone HemW [Candidatus Cloacimonadota bacterium]
MIRYIYLHIPFCIRKCPYCSFYSVSDNQNEKERYLETLSKEIDLYLEHIDAKPHTIYFGGGTPSLLKPDQLKMILEKFDLVQLKEATLEVNPATIDQEYLEKLSELPINRLSLGAQSFNNKELKSLGRLHNSEDNLKCFEMCRDAGFNNISLDLMYGLERQTLDNIASNIKTLIELNPEHISTYCLSIEEDTPFAKQNYQTPDDEIISTFYGYIVEALTKEGYTHYELSNFAREGYQSEHNLAYWKTKNYLGFGASAHGYVDDKRYANPSNLADYYKSVQEKTMYPNTEEQSLETKRKDFIIQGLRLTDGINIMQYNEQFGDDLLKRYSKQLKKYNDFIVVDEQRVYLNSKAYFVSNEILSDFV